MHKNFKNLNRKHHARYPSPSPTLERTHEEKEPTHHAGTWTVPREEVELDAVTNRIAKAVREAGRSVNIHTSVVYTA